MAGPPRQLTQATIDELTMKIENKELIRGSGYIQFPPQRPFQGPVIVQPPTVSHMDYPDVWGNLAPAAPKPAPSPATTSANWRQPAPAAHGNGYVAPMQSHAGVPRPQHAAPGAPRPGTAPQHPGAMHNPYGNGHAGAPPQGRVPPPHYQQQQQQRPGSAYPGAPAPHPGAGYPGAYPGAPRPQTAQPGARPVPAPYQGAPIGAPGGGQYRQPPPMPMHQQQQQQPHYGAPPPQGPGAAPKTRPGGIVAPLSPARPPQAAYPIGQGKPAAAPAAVAASAPSSVSGGEDKRSASQKKRDRKKLRDGAK